MKHKITLTDEDGTLIAQWTIEQEWGDLSKDLPKRMMAQDIADQVREHDIMSHAD